MKKISIIVLFLCINYTFSQFTTVASLGIDSTIYQIKYVSDTEIYVSSNYFKLHKWDGNSWSNVGNFNPIYRGYFQYFASNDIYAAYHPSEDGLKYLAHWDGISWSNVGNFDQEKAIYNFKVISPNEIYAVGDFDYVDNLRWKPVVKYDGNSWSVLGGDSENYGTFAANNSLFVINENDIYSKSDGYTGNIGRERVKHWNGSNWTVLYNHSLDEIEGVRQIHAVSLTEVYTTGRSIESGLASIGKWNGTYWEILGDIQGDLDLWENGTFINFIYVNSNEIYATGYPLRTRTVPPTPGNYWHYLVAKWNGTNWEDFGNLQANYPVEAMDLSRDGYLYIGGSFTENSNTLIKKIHIGHSLNTDEEPIMKKNLISPNPTSNICTLNQEYAKILVKDINGRILDKYFNTSNINLKMFNNGIYFIELETRLGKRFFSKIVKQ